MFLCEFKITSARISVADRLAPSYRSCFVAVLVFTSSYIVLFLVAIPEIKIISHA